MAARIGPGISPAEDDKMIPKLPLFHRKPTPSRPIARIVSGLLTLALLVATIGSVTTFAQDASPVAPISGLAALGYPELRLVATDTGFESPDEVPAGRYLIVLENQGTPGGPAQVSDVNLIQLPPGVHIDELNALLLEGGATPPAWFGEIVSTGGFYVEAGETGYAVLDLEPGDWYVGVGDANPFVPLTVTENTSATPGAFPDPVADVTVEYAEFALNLPDRIPAGNQVWHLSNAVDQQHALTFARTPELMTVEQVQAFVSQLDSGTPQAGIPDPASVEILTSELKNLSPGREIWVELELEPGAYAAICGIPDPGTGAPHVLLGEADTFIVDIETLRRPLANPAPAITS